MTERYPDMVEKIHIGSSYEKYPLYVLKVWEESLIFQLWGDINSPVVLGIPWIFFFFWNSGNMCITNDPQL